MRIYSSRSWFLLISVIPTVEEPCMHYSIWVKLSFSISTGQSIFFTGSAGTGKSYLLKRLISHLPPETTVVTASTGMAACQVSGTTFHSFAGIGTGTESFEDCAKRVIRYASIVSKYFHHELSNPVLRKLGII